MKTHIDLNTLSPDVLIRVIKAREGLTTKQLAHKLGLGVATIATVETRRKPAGYKLLTKLALTYNLNLETLKESAEQFNKTI